jgi:RNA polymerase sigma factor (sigma-70 family)
MEDDAESVLDSMSYREIINSITLLPPAYRMVFNLFVIDGYTHVEIADMLGITTGTSKSNLFKAKNWLRNELQKKMTVKRYV